MDKPFLTIKVKTNVEELNALYLELQQVLDKINNFEIKVYSEEDETVLLSTRL